MVSNNCPIQLFNLVYIEKFVKALLCIKFFLTQKREIYKKS